MGGCAGGALAAAVSNGGGLGLVGGAWGDRDWLERELALAAEQITKPWGVGFLSWAVDVETVEWALEYQPVAMMFSFGDPEPFAGLVRAAGVTLIVQVTDLDEAQRALDVGADVIVAQGSEAGGHGDRRATLPLVPAVVDLVAPWRRAGLLMAVAWRRRWSSAPLTSLPRSARRPISSLPWRPTPNTPLPEPATCKRKPYRRPSLDGELHRSLRPKRHPKEGTRDPQK